LPEIFRLWGGAKGSQGQTIFGGAIIAKLEPKAQCREELFPGHNLALPGVIIHLLTIFRLLTVFRRRSRDARESKALTIATSP